MLLSEVIKYPILTEKTYGLMEKGIYTFAVSPKTHKIEIKKAVEFIFNVKVEKVSIINIDKKPKRVGRFNGFTNSVKKAYVYLAQGNSINLFPQDPSVEQELKTKEVEAESAKTKKASDAEKRAAEKIAAKNIKSTKANTSASTPKIRVRKVADK
ncbi:50S RIBOSOMAL PROTEIN L23 [Mycoplasmopsis pulmonis]|uniref:Large ribosomal subunit protein uL23 n=1 Tax=Mycoplasmopsis pulmonis (strain UAB CTIP) TaxID=272635 RepID=Q98PY3_MYCPU|nr:50S ribosomal protein L23 [Mycoplasmopsis pulmonis]MDZ7293611.1 50S ribosomal protein L23 [Mycoplasmopsis pulmonis]CAC13759.1 50S RIBOSOMAL PROTEIN L23 [Mycoplasmopsis pulmonis]VEU68349.1 50S ribosomal protein L23 [Mycoplasmopsis pulmonis]